MPNNVTQSKITLKKLLQDIAKIDPKHDCIITGIALDSREIKSGDLFLACIGEVLDGRDFIIDAINKGAFAVLVDNSLPEIALPKNIPIIVIDDLKHKAGLIAAKFYGYPARQLTMIGVTGTNGKTSITHYIADILNGLGKPCGIIGTVGIGYPGQLEAVVNTTPDPVTLNHLLFEFVKSGAEVVAMEVSSQGLAQGRLNGIDFTIGVFTNLTHEHLDYHGTMEDYGKTKKSLFVNHNLKHAVINADDEFGCSLIEDLKNLSDIYAYGFSGIKNNFVKTSVVKGEDIELKSELLSCHIVTPWGEGSLKTKLLGRFNLSNLLAGLTVLGIMQIDLVSALAKVSELEPINGRMQTFGGKNKKPLVVVDYAHSPDALEQALLFLREYCRGALWCVFGCGGDRDRSKRPLMGKIAERLSDYVVITNDNPRTEDPKQIVDDVLKGLLCPWAVEVEYDRMVAIEYAINAAKENDLILIAGKGHEDYQIIGTKKRHFSDQEIVAKALDSKI